MCLDQIINNTTQVYKTFYPFFCNIAKIRLHHHRVLAIVHFTIHNREGIVFHRGISRDRLLTRHIIADFGKLRFVVPPCDIQDGFSKLICQIRTVKGNAGRFEASIHALVHNHLAKNHFRVVNKITIDRNPIRVLSEMHPVRLDINYPVPLLQKDDIRSDVSIRVRAECRIRQPNGTQQLSTLSNILAYFRALLVHSALGGNESNHTTGAHLVKCLSEEIVMDQEVITIKRFVRHLIRSERNIADRNIKEILPICGFKAGNGDIRFRIEQACNPARYTVQFHAVKIAVPHGLRKHAEEVAYAAGRFQNVSSTESHLFKSLVHCPDHSWRSIVSIQRGRACHIIFILGQQFFQLDILIAPVFIILIESLRYSAPTNISGKNFLLFGSCSTVFGFNGL